MVTNKRIMALIGSALCLCLSAGAWSKPPEPRALAPMMSATSQVGEATRIPPHKPHFKTATPPANPHRSA
jgi:hypothetical protein